MGRGACPDRFLPRPWRGLPQHPLPQWLPSGACHAFRLSADTALRAPMLPSVAADPRGPLIDSLNWFLRFPCTNPA